MSQHATQLSSNSSPRLNAGVEKILQWRNSPNRFVTDVFGVTPERWQAETLDALANSRRVAVRSGHGVGKSALDSWALLWWMYTRFPSRVPCVAPTMHQIQDILWAELYKWWMKMPELMRDEFNYQASMQNMRFSLKANPAEAFAVGKSGSKDNPEALQGFHSANMLFILDEASGIDDVVFEVAGGALTELGAKQLMTGNPTRTNGYFYNAFHKHRERWWTRKVACQDVERDPEGMRDYIEEKIAEYGEDSNPYRVRVLGDFPAADDDAVIPMDLVEAAMCRDVEPINLLPVWGVDVARYGNCRTALAKRQGNHLLEPVQSWYKRDLMEVAGIIMHEYEDAKSDERPSEILIDSVGLGAGVVDRCRELGLPVRGVNVGEVASGKQRFTNLKAELWWRTRDWFDARDCRIPEDDRLTGQLCSVRYRFTSSGKIQIESKEDMMKRGVHSPDEADAFVLTMAGGTLRMQNDRYRRPVPRRRASSWVTR